MKRHLASIIRPLPLPRHLHRELGFDGVATIRIDRERSFKIGSSGRISNDLFWHGYGRGWEATSLRAWAKLAPSARTIMDIGSNIGVYALAARALAPDARVIAFEPLPRIHDRLLANIVLNGFQIETERVAVSDRSGTATLFDSGRDDFMKARLDVAAPGVADALGQPVTVVRLDEFARRRGISSVDLIKMDIEGHEPAALRGMGELLAASRPTILIEILTDTAAEQVWALFEPLGYEAYRIFERRGMRRSAGLAEQSQKSRNYLLCQPGTVERHGLTELIMS